MQQFTVPQFIDVESKIIGPITTRQFLILLGAALIIGLSFRIFDFALFIFITVIVLIIAALFAFVKINGRPFHYFVLNAIQTLTRKNIRVWNHRATINDNVNKSEVPVKVERQTAVKEYYKKSRLAEIALIVDTKGKYKGE
ncbi:MAG TPA: PrgI family protein [Patescibacteria group bacterium]|nr:PrgI family protein [Patescibacteria group bacterium]